MEPPRWFKKVEFGRDLTNTNPIIQKYYNKILEKLGDLEPQFNSTLSQQNEGPLIEEVESDYEESQPPPILEKDPISSRSLSVSTSRSLPSASLSTPSPTHTGSVSPVTTKSPIEPASSGKQAPPEKSASTYEPAASPYKRVASPYEPAASPYEPATSPYEPAASPYEPATSPYEPAASPYKPVASPYEPAESPYEPVASPYEPATSPYEPVASPHEPAVSPYEPASHLSPLFRVEKVTRQDPNLGPLRRSNRQRWAPLDFTRLERPIYGRDGLIGFAPGFPAQYQYGRKEKVPAQKVPKTAIPSDQIEFKEATKGNYSFCSKNMERALTGFIKLAPGQSKPESKTSMSHSYMFNVKRGQVVVCMVEGSKKTQHYMDVNSWWLPLDSGKRYSIKNYGSTVAIVAYVVIDK